MSEQERAYNRFMESWLAFKITGSVEVALVMLENLKAYEAVENASNDTLANEIETERE